MATLIDTIILVVGMTTCSCGVIFLILRYISTQCFPGDSIIHPFPYERSGTAPITRTTILVEGIPSESTVESAITVKPYQDNIIYPVVYVDNVEINAPLKSDEDATDYLVANLV